MAAAIGADLGGPGERHTHRLVAAHAAVRLGDFSGALDLTRQSEYSTPIETGRDALLVASLDATVAQRSGDTARLRDAWATARPLVERGLETWLLADQIVDLAVTGVRIGEPDPATRLFERLAKSLDGLPSAGPASIIVSWGRLQLDVAAERWDLVESLGSKAKHGTVLDERSAARRIARSAWAQVAAARSGNRSASFELVSEAADALASVGDDWDASRLLGQAALDDDDPQRARELLERARALVSEPVESSDRLVAAGLSEREAEVSRLVIEGHTYKEIGAVLYISPKTVEHHVARIRQRLGATSRAELLAMVRELLIR
jgi:DNA-binding CsgD family transcriptional regulator